METYDCIYDSYMILPIGPNGFAETDIGFDDIVRP